MSSTNVAENGRQCDCMLNFRSTVRQIGIVENESNKTFMASLTDRVISRMRTNSSTAFVTALYAMT